MSSLCAVYEVTLPKPLLVWSEPVAEGTEEWRLPPEIAVQRVTVEDFECRVELKHPSGHPLRVTADKKALFTVSRMEVRVSRQDDEAPPRIVRDAEGNEDIGDRSRYLDTRYKEYTEVAKTLVGRVIAFARHRLGIEGARGIEDVEPRCFLNPKWFYDDDGPLRNPTIRLAGRLGLPGTLADWSMRGITPSDRTWLSGLGDPHIPLHRELHALSKDAAGAGDLRRAVIEMAVAIEVATKHAFFAPASAAFEAFEFLEEKRKVEVTVVELLRQPAERAFGRSFRDVDEDAFRLIEEIFRCRNKVAHRGRIEYRNSKGDLMTADRSVVRRWWLASETLLDWLESDCGLEDIRGLDSEDVGE